MDFPTPITGGNSVYEVNGYWVTAPEADEAKGYAWNTNTSATTMASNPCDGNGDWKMPTMLDYQDMAGWATAWPWSDAVSRDLKNIASDVDVWNAAFPANANYWSSLPRSSEVNAWLMFTKDDGTGCYGWSGKQNTYQIRCVQKKK